MQKLTAYVHDDTAAALQAHARANDRSLAGELRRALRMYVQMIDRTFKPEPVLADNGTGGAVPSSSAGPPTNDDGRTGTRTDTRGDQGADRRGAPRG